MSDRQPVASTEAPAAIGPYSQAIRYGDLLFCSGALPIDPASADLVTDSLGAETKQCLRNLAAICAGAGTDLSRTLRMTVYTTDLDGFAEINDAYASFFGDSPPARVAIGVAALPKGARVEVDAIVAIP